MSDIVQWADIIDKKREEAAVAKADPSSPLEDVGTEIVTLLREIARNTSFLGMLGRPVAVKMKRLVQASPVIPVAQERKSKTHRQKNVIPLPVNHGTSIPNAKARGQVKAKVAASFASAPLASPPTNTKGGKTAIQDISGSRPTLPAATSQSTSQQIQASRARSQESQQLIATIGEGNQELVNTIKEQPPKSDSWLNRLVKSVRGVPEEKKQKGLENIGEAVGGGYYEAYQEGKEIYQGLKEDYSKIKDRFGKKGEGSAVSAATTPILEDTKGRTRRDANGRFISADDASQKIVNAIEQSDKNAEARDKDQTKAIKDIKPGQGDKKESAGIIQRAKDKIRGRAKGKLGKLGRLGKIGDVLGGGSEGGGLGKGILSKLGGLGVAGAGAVGLISSLLGLAGRDIYKLNTDKKYSQDIVDQGFGAEGAGWAAAEKLRQSQISPGIGGGNNIPENQNRVIAGINFGAGTVNGKSLGEYAPGPHADRVRAIYNNLPDMNSAENIQAELSKYKSPLNASTVLSEANRVGIDPRILMAQMKQDSTYMTAGKAVRTNNPGNVGNDDAGNLKYFSDPNQGIAGLADNLAKRKVGGMASGVTPQMLSRDASRAQMSSSSIPDVMTQEAIKVAAQKKLNCGEGTTAITNAGLLAAGVDSGKLLPASNLGVGIPAALAKNFDVPLLQRGNITLDALRSLGAGTTLGMVRKPGEKNYEYGKTHAESLQISPTGELAVASPSAGRGILWKKLDEQYVKDLPAKTTAANPFMNLADGEVGVGGASPTVSPAVAAASPVVTPAVAGMPVAVGSPGIVSSTTPVTATPIVTPAIAGGGGGLPSSTLSIAQATIQIGQAAIGGAGGGGTPTAIQATATATPATLPNPSNLIQTASLTPKAVPQPKSLADQFGVFGGYANAVAGAVVGKGGSSMEGIGKLVGLFEKFLGSQSSRPGEKSNSPNVPPMNIPIQFDDTYLTLMSLDRA